MNAAHTASPGNPRLSVSAGSSCSRRSGRFTIREVVITSGTVQRFAADFEQHCNNIDPALFWLPSSTNYSYAAAGARQWGDASAGDVPLLKDLDGDGRVDFTVWRLTTGVWYWLTSTSGHNASGSREWGSTANGDIPIGR